ncbi:hypothetical protein DSCO28_34510 [Desulfosarcina ovata subsp. sediminis]|uniref:Uncharacterized protein n=1 Tax=Desulfosarcina ovata subsp. sediminis TaxID=885957 RepID=A0A5K7ZPL6_9BACT|nr:hypothetical protein DSCO28_34510 [Desulfosarcina ovata subsp. sediminis]
MDGAAAADTADDNGRFTVDGAAGLDVQNGTVSQGLDASGQIAAQGVGAVIKGRIDAVAAGGTDNIDIDEAVALDPTGQGQLFAEIEFDHVGGDAGVVSPFGVVQVLGLDLHDPGIKGQGFSPLDIPHHLDGIGNKEGIHIEGGVNNSLGTGTAHRGGVLDVTQLHQGTGVTDSQQGEFTADGLQIAHGEVDCAVGAEQAIAIEVFPVIKNSIAIDILVKGHGAAVFATPGFSRAAEAVAKAAVDTADGQGVVPVDLVLAGSEVDLVGSQADGTVTGAKVTGDKIKV